MTNAAQQAGQSQTARRVVLVGWAAKGVVYLALAYLVLQLAFGSSSEETSTNGALKLLAGTPAGAVTLVVLGVGLLAFAVGRILEVTTLAGSQIDGKDKVEAVGLAVVYVSLAFSAFSIVLSAGSGGSGDSAQKGSGVLLGLPGGQILVGLIGLAVIGAGLYSIYKGVKHDYLGTLRTGEMSAKVRSLTDKLGLAAYVTKGATLALVGVFVVQAALTYDPDKARGLDGALQELAEQSWGPYVLALVALGFLAYGLFGFLEARYRRIGSSATGTT